MCTERITIVLNRSISAKNNRTKERSNKRYLYNYDVVLYYCANEISKYFVRYVHTNIFTKCFFKCLHNFVCHCISLYRESKESYVNRSLYCMCLMIQHNQTYFSTKRSYLYSVKNNPT